MVADLIESHPEYTVRTNDLLMFKEWVAEAKETNHIPMFRGNQKIVTASKQEENVADAPATVYVVNAETIGMRGYRNLKELLEDIPEIEIQSKSVAEFRNYYSFRGVSGNEKFIILLNGFRFNSPTGAPHVIESNYPLTNVKRVEIILGPASALYGADAFGGIVNIITYNGNELHGGSFTLSAGEYGSQDATLTYGQKLKGFSFALTGQFYKSDEPNFAEIYRDRYAWHRDRFLTDGVVLNLPFGDQTEVQVPESLRKPYSTPTEASYIQASFQAGNFELGYSVGTESHNNSVHGRPEYSLYIAEANSETTVSSVYGKHLFRSGDWKIQSSFWRGSFEIDPGTRFINVFSAYRPGFKYAKSQTFRVEEQIHYVIPAQGSLIFGVSYEDVSALPKTGDLPFAFDANKPGDLQNLYYLGTNVDDRFGNTLRLPQQFFNLNYENTAAYIQYQRPWRKANLTVGGRFDNSSRYGSAFTPRAGLVFAPLKRMKVKLLYGESFFAPSTAVTYQQFGSFITVDADGNPTNDPTEIDRLFSPFWHVPNSELKPEKMSSWEISFSYYLKETLGVFANYYDTGITDRVENQVESDGVFLGIPVGAIEMPVNIGELNTRGGTIGFSGLIQLDKIRLDTRLAYSFSDGDLNGGKLTYSARDTVKAGVDLIYKKWSVSTSYLYRGKSYHQLTNSAGENLTNQPTALSMSMAAMLVFTARADTSFLDLFGSSIFLTENTPMSRSPGLKGFPTRPRTRAALPRA